MFAITRSLIRLPTFCQAIQQNGGAIKRQVTMRVVPAIQSKQESFDEKNVRLGRELSPHLTIYKPQLTSMLSITHRGTGMAVSVYAYALGLGALISSHDVSHYVTMIEGLQLSAASLILLKSVLAFPVAFHVCNGVRHLFWDTGRFLKMKEVYTTGYAMVAASLLLTLGFALL